MNKQPYYHDIRIRFHDCGIDPNTFNGFLDNAVIDQLTHHVNKILTNVNDCELVEGTVEVVGDHEELQVLFTTTNGYEPSWIYEEIRLFIGNKLIEHLTNSITVDVLSSEPEAGDPCDLM